MIRRGLIAAAVALLAVAWTTLAQTPPAAPITSVHMVDPNTGWAQTADRLLRTVDSGGHWTDVSPSGPAGTGVPTTAFLGASTAWVAPAPATAGSTLVVFRTVDGGRTWARARVAAASVGQIAFVDARTGWMTVDLDNAAGSEALRLLRTADGGATWAEAARTDLPTAPARSGLPFNGDKSGFTFLDPRTGWMAGYVPRDDYSYLYVTRDAGTTWQRQALPVPAGIGTVEFGLTPPFVYPSGDAVLVVQLHTASQALTLVYVTHDRGRRWISTAPVPTTASAASFPTARIGWLTDGRALYATTDAGHHWTALPRSALFAGVTELNFVSPAVGWAARDGTPSLLKTADGGHTWVAVP